MNNAIAKPMTPITTIRVSRTSGSRTTTFFTGGGGSRRIRDPRTGADRLTDFFPVGSGLAMQGDYEPVVIIGLAMSRSDRLFTTRQPCSWHIGAMGMRELLIGAIVLGAAGGYYWSTPYSVTTDVRKVPASQRPPAAALANVPPTAEDAEADSAWSSGGAQPEMSGTSSSAPKMAEQSVYYPGCNAVRAAGKAPLHSGEPGYRIEMDGDGDGVACEPIRR